MIGTVHSEEDRNQSSKDSVLFIIIGRVPPILFVYSSTKQKLFVSVHLFNLIFPPLIIKILTFRLSIVLTYNPFDIVFVHKNFIIIHMLMD